MVVERKQRKTYACELYRERGSGLNGPSMMNNVKWENKWRNTGKGAQHPTTLEMSNFRPLHARCSPEPMFGHQANSSSFNSTAGSSRPRSVTWEDEPGMPATLSECGSRGLGKPQMSTTQQFYQGRPVRSVSPPPRPTHSTQKQLSHTSYIFGNVEVVNPVGRPSSTLDPLHHTGWVQPNANLTNSGPWPSDFNGRPSSVAEGATRGQAGRSPSPTERAPSCPPVISSCGQFENGEASAAPGWRSSQRLSEVFSADGTGLSSDPDNMLVAAAEVENFPVGARHRLHAGPQRTAIYGRPVPNLEMTASGMHSTNSFGAKEIRKWNRPHTFNSSGLPYWPWENTPSAGKAGYDPSKDPTLNPQITFKRVEKFVKTPQPHPAARSDGIYRTGTTHWRV